MFEKLAKKIFNKKVRTFLRSSQRQTMFVSYSRATSFFLLFESDTAEQNAGIRQLIEQLRTDGKKVTAWGYLPAKGTGADPESDITVLHKNDFDLLQRPGADVLHQLKKERFDVLIDLTSHHYIAVDYLILNAEATLRTGIQKSDQPLYDFALEIPDLLPDEKGGKEEDQTINNYNQLIFYLKNIQSKDY